MLYMFLAFSLPIIRSSKIVHKACGICQAYLLLPVAWVSLNSDMHIILKTAVVIYLPFYHIVNSLLYTFLLKFIDPLVVVKKIKN